jgi:glycosyltransferase involved in cell wall biosynthesis
MTSVKKIVFTVTTDLTYDQRMQRICTSLSNEGYKVLLIGCSTNTSAALQPNHYIQKRIRCVFKKGKLFYIEYNIKLLVYLLFIKMDAICAIDLDTIIPCYYISKIKKKPRVYDAHELFCEMKEIVRRPLIYKFWKKIEQYYVPKFKNGYTVNEPIATEFNKMYGVNYDIVRNIALLRELPNTIPTKKYILYQGAVNEGRSFETLIPAMQQVDGQLIICGDGNFMQQTKKLVAQNNVYHKVIFKGKIMPDELRSITQQAYIGITLFDTAGLSNYYSLANRFFDYLHAGIPQLCVNYPVYAQLNKQYPFALLINDISANSIAAALNNLLHNSVVHNTLKQNCLKARQLYNWQQEEVILKTFYKQLFINNQLK